MDVGCSLAGSHSIDICNMRAPSRADTCQEVGKYIGKWLYENHQGKKMNILLFHNIVKFMKSRYLSSFFKDYFLDVDHV